MNWKDNLREGSFRGVKFFISNSSLETGRRVSVHEFPNKNNSFAEDMGRATTTYKIEGHLIGDDYFEQKRNLILAMEKQDAGELVHPYYGTLQVQSAGFLINEDNFEGRIATFSATFYSDDPLLNPTETIDKKAVANQTIFETVTNSIDEFNKVFDKSKLPVDRVKTAREKVQGLIGNFRQATQGLETLADNVLNLSIELDGLQSDIETLLNEPVELSKRLDATFDLLIDSIESAFGKAQSLIFFIGVFENNDPSISTVTVLGNQEFENLQAINTLTKQLIVSKLVGIAIDEEFSNIVDAANRRNQIKIFIDEQLENVTNDFLFQNLLDLNSILITSVPDRDIFIPNLKSLMLNQTTNSLNLAYRIYQNIDKEKDLILRNEIKDPLFIPSNLEIEYIENV